MEILLGAMILGGIVWYFVSNIRIRSSYERGYYEGKRAGLTANIQRQPASDEVDSAAERRLRARAYGQL